MITYKNVSLLAASVAAALFLTLLIAPELIFQLFGLVGNESAYFLSRRAAMLFFGMAALTFSSRHAPHSDARQSICIGVGASMLLLAILGVVELVRGVAGAGILLAIGGELVIAAAYYAVWSRANRDLR